MSLLIVATPYLKASSSMVMYAVTYEWVVSRMEYCGATWLCRVCNTLQHSACHIWSTGSIYTATHTAAHCNTLQHISTHCNTLQHTATHCVSHCNTLHVTLHVTLQRTATHWVSHYNTLDVTLQHTATHYNTLQHTATHSEARAVGSLQGVASCGRVLQYVASCCSVYIYVYVRIEQDRAIGSRNTRCTPKKKPIL